MPEPWDPFDTWVEYSGAVQGRGFNFVVGVGNDGTVRMSVVDPRGDHDRLHIALDLDPDAARELARYIGEAADAID